MAWSRNMTWDSYYCIPKDYKDLYLTKLGVKKEKPTIEYLNYLIRKNIETIPFKNLDVTDLHTPVSIDPICLQEKILKKNRGGFCFELNGAFYLLLKSLGFDAWMCQC